MTGNSEIEGIKVDADKIISYASKDPYFTIELIVASGGLKLGLTPSVVESGVFDIVWGKVMEYTNKVCKETESEKRERGADVA